jgi:hypothetical protein
MAQSHSTLRSIAQTITALLQVCFATSNASTRLAPGRFGVSSEVAVRLIVGSSNNTVIQE